MVFTNEPVFLRSDVRIEPLVDSFPAELLDVAPVQASLRLAGRWVPMLESYLRDPGPHGGMPAVRSTLPSTMEVGALLDSVKRDRADMLAFAAAVNDADHILGRRAGAPLAFLYDDLPPSLDGLVEISTDQAGRAQLRFVEPAAYDSPIYDVERQSIRLVRDGTARRPGVRSIPRPDTPDALDLAVPFAHPGLDALARARNTPTTVAQLCAALGLNGTEPGRLGRFLTSTPTAGTDRHIGHGGRARYLGHACLMLQSPQATVLVDPSVGSGRRRGGCGLEDLPDRVDFVLLTRAHRDHTVLETLLQLRSRIGTVVVPRSSRGNRWDPSIGLCLRALGFAVLELDDFDELPIPGGRVMATPFLAEGSGSDIRAKSTYVIQLSGASVFVGGDAGCPRPAVYRQIRRRVGPIHMAFLGTHCGAADLDGADLDGADLDRADSDRADSDRADSNRADSDRAGWQPDGIAERYREIIRSLDADEAYVLGSDAWHDPGLRGNVEQLLDWCGEHGITAEQLAPGRTWRW
jgi:hypothetical protein